MDIDLSSHKRDVAFNSVKEYLNSFGGDIVRIGTFKTDKPKSAVQTACRGLGLPVDVGMYLSSLIPVDRGQPRSIKEVVYGDEEKGFEPVREFINQMDRYPGLLDTILGIEGLVSGRGTHACFSGDTLVVTKDGIKEIKDVCIGDMVLTHDNTYKPVINTMVRKSGDILQIKCYGSLPTTTTSNHKFYTTKGWIEAKKLTTKDYIGFAINNENIIPKGDLPFDSKEFWWFIGRFLGDGWLEAPYRKGIQHNYDKKILLCCNALNNEREDIERNLEALGYGYRVGQSGSVLKYVIKYKENEKLYEYLETFGKYAYGKHFNSDILSLPKILLEALLQGYFSADGHLYNDGTQSYKTVSKKLCLDIQEAVAKVYNTYTNISVQQPKDELICGRKCNGRIKYEGKFKVNKIKKGRSYYKDGYLWCSVKEIKEVSELIDVYNLTVLDNSSYTANGLIVHNCGIVVSNNMLKHTATMKAPNGDTITQYDLGDSEYCGLIKYDFLNTTTLGMMQIAFENLIEKGHIEWQGSLRKTYNKYLHPDNIDYNNPEYYEKLNNHELIRVFQFESGQGLKALNTVKPQNLIELAAANTLMRLQCEGEQPMERYVRIKANPQEWEQEMIAYGLNKHEREVLHGYLDIDYGTCTTQEMLMILSMDKNISGFTIPEANMLRKGVAKKKKSVLDKVQKLYYEKGAKLGTRKVMLDYVWNVQLSMQFGLTA